MKRLLLVLVVFSSVLMAMDRPYATEFIEKQQQVKIKEAQEKESKEKKELEEKASKEKEAEEKERKEKIAPLNEQLLKILQDLYNNRQVGTVTAADRQNIENLLNQGADVNVVDISQRTPLHFALEIRDLPLVQLLINNKADLNKKDLWGKAPLHIAVTGIKTKNEDIELAKLLLENGANINIQSERGDTPLMLAVEWGNKSLVQLLIDGLQLKKGYSIEGISSLGSKDNTYFQLLPAELRQHTYEHLKMIKANPHIKNNPGKTALDLAREQKYAHSKEIIEILEAATANYSLPQQNVSQQQLQPQINPQPAAKQKSWWQLWKR